MKSRLYESTLFLRTLMIFVAVWGTACAHTIGSGVTASSPREVTPFERLIVSGQMRVNLEVGDEYRVLISGDDNLISRVKVLNDGDALRIQAPKGSIQKANLEVTVVTRRLSGITASLTENVDINVSGKHLDTVDVRLSGVGNLVVTNLNATSVRSQMDGTGILRVSGGARNLEFRMSGLGTADFERLCIHTADVKVHGLGKVVVNADEFLDATIRGLGKITYVGDPSIHRDVKGGGKVTAREEKLATACAGEKSL